MTQSFDVFLSHNSKDKLAVRELAEALRARGLKVWLDEWELVPGRRWQEALEEVIETTGAAAVLVGKDGLGPWHVTEMRGCLSEFVDRNLPVIPVLLPDAPEGPRLPIFLKGFTWVDLRGGLAKEGIDQLLWGITGNRPDCSMPPSPNLALEAVTAGQAALAEAQLTPIELKPAPPELEAPATVVQEQPDQKARTRGTSFGFTQAFPLFAAWTFAYSAVIPSIQTLVEWPAAPTVGNWFWFLVRWLFLGLVSLVIGLVTYEIKKIFGMTLLGFGACLVILGSPGFVRVIEGGSGPSLSSLFFPGNFVYVTFAALAGGLIYLTLSITYTWVQFLSRWLFWVAAWSVSWWLSVYLLGLIPAGQIDPFTTATLGVMLVSWWVFLIRFGLKRL